MQTVNVRFQHFSAFINYIESLPPFYLTYGERKALLLKAKVFVEAHDLIPEAPIVTVTGTNGKGSTVKALAEILVQYGLNVCAFTSPHLLSYTERFAYNLHFIDEETLLRLANTLATLIDLSQWSLFFILFFINLLWCKESPLDCLILEVGIGGRLDPSNILDASLVILTQVALDHTEMLGDTCEAIGFEKAALLRKRIPFICGDPSPPYTVIEKAKQLHCHFYQINKQFGFYVRGNEWDLWFENVMFCSLPAPMIHLVSLSCALQAVKLLFPTRPFTKRFMDKKLPEIYLPARYQQLTYEGTELLIDVSHNPAAVEALEKFLQFLPKKYNCAIFGGKNTKDIEGIIEVMKDVIDEWYLVPIDHSEGMPAETLAKFFESFSIQPNITLSVSDAMQKIQTRNLANARIIAFGSFRVAGPALAFVGAKIHGS